MLIIEKEEEVSQKQKELAELYEQKKLMLQDKSQLGAEVKQQQSLRKSRLLIMIDETDKMHVSEIDPNETNPLKQSLGYFELDGEDELYAKLVALCKKQRK